MRPCAVVFCEACLGCTIATNLCLPASWFLPGTALVGFMHAEHQGLWIRLAVQRCRVVPSGPTFARRAALLVCFTSLVLCVFCFAVLWSASVARKGVSLLRVVFTAQLLNNWLALNAVFFISINFIVFGIVLCQPESRSS